MYMEKVTIKNSLKQLNYILKLINRYLKLKWVHGERYKIYILYTNIYNVLL